MYIHTSRKEYEFSYFVKGYEHSICIGTFDECMRLYCILSGQVMLFKNVLLGVCVCVCRKRKIL